jgi:hypothetical protein
VVGSKSLVASVALGALLLTASASMASAQGNGNGQGQNQQGTNGPNGNAYGYWRNNPSPSLAATPELDSIVLFGAGLAGVAGYGALRWKARRR